MLKYLNLIFILSILNAISFSQENISNDKRVILTKQISTGKIELDGLLNEPEWKMVSPAKDFIQRDPIEGAPSTEKTEVYVVYDNNNLYIGAMLLIVIQMEFLPIRNVEIRAYAQMIVLCGF